MHLERLVSLTPAEPSRRSGCDSSVSLQIENIDLPVEPKSKKRRGFIFITYKEEASAKKCLEKKFHTVEGSRVAHQLFFFSSSAVKLSVSWRHTFFFLALLSVS